jgi:hypothetical protein
MKFLGVANQWFGGGHGPFRRGSTTGIAGGVDLNRILIKALSTFTF